MAAALSIAVLTAVRCQLELNCCSVGSSRWSRGRLSLSAAVRTNIGSIEPTTSTDRQAPEIDELVAGRYRLERLLARGGMGEVFVALDQSSGARIALKRMLLRAGQQRSPVVHFMREYHALSELRHPRIIEVYDYGVDRERPYYTMELLDGADLHELSPIPYREACRYLRDVASSLALLHARRLLHRDLSPRNVRRMTDGRCKLLDFGAMVPFGVAPNLTGTVPCIAPEALQGGTLDQRTDLYSLGAMAYFVLTGRFAHHVNDFAALTRAWKDPVLRPSRLVSDVPEALDELVIALLSMDALQRPGSAAEVIDRLSAVAELPPDPDHDELAIARSFLTGSQLVGRAHECAKLQKYIKRGLSGTGSALLVCGDSGTGRSRMLAEAALIGQTQGLTVVRAVARSSESTGSLATSLVQGLKRAVPFEAQRAAARRPRVAAEAYGADSGEERVQVLNEITGFAQEVARARPLLITIDDLDRADELSGALAAALAYQSSECPISVIASYDGRHEPPMLANVPGLAETISLAPLDRALVSRLVASLFGDVPHLERVSEWLYRVAGGNPKLTLQLADHLLTQGVVRYVGGTWVLPTELSEALPPSAAEALLLRLRELDHQARELAELLCVSPSGAAAERILDLARLPADQVFGALDALVRAGVLESAGNAYVFAQDALRASLRDSLPAGRRHELHHRWAEKLLSGTPDESDRLAAGWHLVHTEDALRGADILAEIAPDLVERRASMAVAVPSLERALEVYERHGRPLAQRMRLRSLLVMSSFLFDHRLAERHAGATLDALYPFTGLPLIERLSRVLGKHIGFVLGVACTLLRWLLRPPRTRGPVVFNALKYYARACMGLVGLRALAFDVDGISAGLHRMRVFEGLPHPALRLVHSLAKVISLHNRGRGAEIGSLVQVVKERLSRPILMMSTAERTDLLSGVMMLEGINECYRERSDALSHARRLEQLGTPLAAAAAMRICMVYHLIRGELERTQHYRRLLDLSAIQNGTVWQIDWIVVPIEGLAGATWSDLIAMRRSLDALDKLIAEVPSFANMRDNVRIGYHFRRGDYAAAVRFGEEYIKAHPPFTLIGWAFVYGLVTFAYLELGEADKALQLSETAMALVGPQHLQYVIQYSTLEAAYATALIVSGQRARGEQMFEEMMRGLTASGEHTRAFLMHEYRVKMARLLGDRAGVAGAITDMRNAALASGNPNAILLADSVQNLRTRTRSSPLPPAQLAAAAQHPETTSMTVAQETIVTQFLKGEEGLRLRARHALHMLGQYAGGEAYLYWVKRGELELAASLEDRDPPAGLESLLSMKAANDQTVDLAADDSRSYMIVRLTNAANDCVGLAALRHTASNHGEIPPALIADIGRALVDTGT